MKLNKILLCLMLVGFTAPLGFAGANSGHSKSKSNIRTITGCLAKGEDRGEFNLTANDGSTWEVRSSRLASIKHVVPTATETGLVGHAMDHNMKEDAKDA